MLIKCVFSQDESSSPEHVFIPSLRLVHSKVQQQNETLRDEASRAKLCGAEATRFDRRLAELAGSYQGLSSEMELQMRRVEQMDDRLRRGFNIWTHIGLSRCYPLS